MESQKTEVGKVKYSIGQLVWFYTLARSTDDIISYPCISRGPIGGIHPTDAGEFNAHFRHEELLYSIPVRGGHIYVKEEDIYPDCPDEAIKRLVIDGDKV